MAELKAISGRSDKLNDVLAFVIWKCSEIFGFSCSNKGIYSCIQKNGGRIIGHELFFGQKIAIQMFRDWNSIKESSISSSILPEILPNQSRWLPRKRKESSFPKS